METALPAGEWRRALRRDAGASVRWQALATAAHAVSDATEPGHACAAVLTQALTLLGLTDGAVLAQRGARTSVLASQGRALPPGASVALDASADMAWLLPPLPRNLQAFTAPITALGNTHGSLCVAWNGRAGPGTEDRQTLHAFAALLPAIVAEPARASRRRRVASPPLLTTLSPRERQVLSLLPRGLTNAALATELGISPGTVKVHVERILQKLELSDRTQAAVYAVQAGIAL